jgi:malonate-semialdehyde dehydrogenase (acetylating)/methylmalonate-semialdehyde dehydrogenase
VLNVVHGTHATVNRILDHPDIKAVSFVGSNAAGQHVYARGSAAGKRVQVRRRVGGRASGMPMRAAAPPASACGRAGGWARGRAWQGRWQARAGLRQPAGS